MTTLQRHSWFEYAQLTWAVNRLHVPVHLAARDWYFRLASQRVALGLPMLDNAPTATTQVDAAMPYGTSSFGTSIGLYNRHFEAWTPDTLLFVGYASPPTSDSTPPPPRYHQVWSLLLTAPHGWNFRWTDPTFVGGTTWRLQVRLHLPDYWDTFLAAYVASLP